MQCVSCPRKTETGIALANRFHSLAAAEGATYNDPQAGGMGFGEGSDHANEQIANTPT